MANPTFHFWRREGKLWYAALADINQAIQESGKPVFELKRKLGNAFNALLQAKQGEGISDWAVASIEYALARNPGTKTLIDFFPPSSLWRKYGKPAQLSFALPNSRP